MRTFARSLLIALMEKKVYNKDNFHKYTFCVFTEVDFDLIKEDKPNYKSKSGSSYYFKENGVYRLSNHWGRAANCRWRLYKKSDSDLNRTKLGFARWTDFYPDNDFQPLYYIVVDFEKQTAEFFHKATANYNKEVQLRTASETMKRIRQIRKLFEDKSWIKHLDSENDAAQIIDQLVSTNKTFQEIRSAFLK